MNKKGVLLGPQIILLPACKLWCIKPPLEVFYLWNIVSKCKPADAFLSQDLRQYLSNLAEQCNSEETDTELPTVVILDNLHHIGSLSDIFNGFLNCKYHKWWDRITM